MGESLSLYRQTIENGIQAQGLQFLNEGCLTHTDLIHGRLVDGDHIWRRGYGIDDPSYIHTKFVVKNGKIVSIYHNPTKLDTFCYDTQGRPELHYGFSQDIELNDRPLTHQVNLTWENGIPLVRESLVLPTPGTKIITELNAELKDPSREMPVTDLVIQFSDGSSTENLVQAMQKVNFTPAGITLEKLINGVVSPFDYSRQRGQIPYSPMISDPLSRIFGTDKYIETKTAINQAGDRILILGLEMDEEDNQTRSLVLGEINGLTTAMVVVTPSYNSQDNHIYINGEKTCTVTTPYSPNDVLNIIKQFT